MGRCADACCARHLYCSSVPHLDLDAAHSQRVNQVEAHHALHLLSIVVHLHAKFKAVRWSQTRAGGMAICPSKGASRHLSLRRRRTTGKPKHYLFFRHNRDSVALAERISHWISCTKVIGHAAEASCRRAIVLVWFRRGAVQGRGQARRLPRQRRRQRAGSTTATGTPPIANTHRSVVLDERNSQLTSKPRKSRTSPTIVHAERSPKAQLKKADESFGGGFGKPGCMKSQIVLPKSISVAPIWHHLGIRIRPRVTRRFKVSTGRGNRTSHDKRASLALQQ